MSTEKAPIWAIVSVDLDTPSDASAVDYKMTFNGEDAATLRIVYDCNPVTGRFNCVTCIEFEEAHQGNDGAYVTCVAMKALYDNQTAMRESTGVADDFEFVHEAFEFLGRPLEFTY